MALVYQILIYEKDRAKKVDTINELSQTTHVACNVCHITQTNGIMFSLTKTARRSLFQMV